MNRSAPIPWAEGETIPWHEPGFSRRMLREHLTQDHDLASRRAKIIDAQTAWIHQVLLLGQASRILDLGCGPGLYANRLARFGHQCLGIDFSPASIAYAQEQAQDLDCTYILGDMRDANFGAGRDLAMLVFGEFNIFRPADVRRLLAKIHAALRPGGLLLLEPHRGDFVRDLGLQAPSQRDIASGLFAPDPHTYCEEHFWDAEQRAATTRYTIRDSATGATTRYAGSMQSYDDDEYRALLSECGFVGIHLYTALGGDDAPLQPGLFALTGKRG